MIRRLQPARLALVALAAVTAGTLTACGEVAEAEVGTYTATLRTEGHPSLGQMVAAPPFTLTVERDPDVIRIRDEAGEVRVVVEATARDEGFFGCPDNVASTEMEVLDLGLDHLDIAGLSLDLPVLVADCGGGDSGQVTLVLRDAGDDTVDMSTACDGAQSGCLFFTDGDPADFAGP